MEGKFDVLPIGDFGAEKRAMLMQEGAPALVSLNVRPSTTYEGRTKAAFIVPVSDGEAVLLGHEFRMEAN